MSILRSQKKYAITNQNHRGRSGTIGQLANWITLVVACLATLTKVATKMRKIRNLQGDDYIMLAAIVCYSLVSKLLLEPHAKILKLSSSFQP